MSKSVPEPRQAVFDELGVSRPTDSTGLYVSLSEMDVADLVCEGEIEGLVSGEYIFEGTAGETGYQSYDFNAYTALDENGNCNTGLGYLRSVFWNETPVVDKDGFYNFQEINVEWNSGLPQGKLPSLNPNLANDKNIKGESIFELTLFRNIGERLFGPSIDANHAPGYYILNGELPNKKKRSLVGAMFGSQAEKVIDSLKDPLVGGALGETLVDAAGNPIVGAGAQLIPASEVAPVSQSLSNAPIIIGEVDRNAKTYIISNKECIGIRVNIRVTRLLEQIQDDPHDNIKVRKGDEDKRGFFAQPEDTADDGKQQIYGAGDMRARKIKYQIYTRPIFDTRHANQKIYVPWQKKPDIDDEIFGRIEEPYVRSVDINFNTGIWKDLNPRDGENYDFFQGWEVKIIRLTPDSLHTFLKNESFIDSIVEVYDSKLRYPYSAMVYSKFSAEFFSRIPSRAYDTKLLKIKIPNNYDPILRSYDESSGYWDGCFKAKKAWSNNPAWCFYDLITNNRYGLGEYIESQYVDKWTLYEIAKYCDTLVPDGRGGLEPRFTLNHIITSREEAYKVVNDIASAFRSLVYYAFGNIYVSQDRPKDPIYQFTTSNVVDGLFNYSSSAKKARHTVSIIRYNDKNNMYKPAIVYVEDQAGIQRYGIREIETTAIGCSSEGQAKRFGEWILRSEILETESVTFTAGQEGMYIRPGDVINLYDEFRNERKLAGRTFQVKEVNSGVIPSAIVPSSISSSDYPITGNSIIIDKAIDFTPDKVYKLSLLTPTSYFEPTQITPTVCEETVTTTVVPATTEERVKEQNEKIYLDYTLNLNDVGASFSTTESVIVDGAEGEYRFDYQSFNNASKISRGSGDPKRFILYYVKDGETYYLNLMDGTFSTDQFAGSFYMGTVLTLNPESHLDSKHGQQVSEARHGDLLACLARYSNAEANAELYFLKGCESDGTDCSIKDTQNFVDPITDGFNSIKTFKEGRGANKNYAEGVRTFTKPFGVTTISIKVIHPINSTSTLESASSITSNFRTGLVRTHQWVIKESTEEKTIETIDVSATNTDKALTSAEIPEIRRNQIQTVTFSGFQALTHTGNYSSDFSVGGSGIVTQIFLESGIQELDFTGYVITGYNTSSVIGDLANGNEQEYSSTYENYSGSDLVWSIEPAISDMTLNRDYTLDKELASGYSQQYRVINVTENEKKYDITAIEYTPVKFDDILEVGGGGPGGGGGGPGGGPPENPRLDDDNDGGGGGGGNDPDPFNPIEGEEGACCADYGDDKICYNNQKRSECTQLDTRMREKGEGFATFHKDKSCDDIDCKPPYKPEIPVDPIDFPPPPIEDAIQKFLDLNFKFHFDLSSFAVAKKQSNLPRGWKLKVITDAEAHENAEFTVIGSGKVSNTYNDLAADLGVYYEEVLMAEIFDGEPKCAELKYPYIVNGVTVYEEIQDCYKDNYERKTTQYGGNFLILKSVFFTDLTPQGYLHHAAGDECGKVDHSELKLTQFRKPVTAAYGLPEFAGSPFADPKWNAIQADEECNPPVKNSYILFQEPYPEAGKNENRWGVYDTSIREGKLYFISVPDQKYQILVQQFIYKFPNFLRDGNNNPVTQERADEATQDIREILFADLTHNVANDKGVKPYAESCICSEEPVDGVSLGSGAWKANPNFIDDPFYTTDIDDYQAQPFSDINLAYTDAILDDSSRTMKEIITRDDIGTAFQCKGNDKKNSLIFNFDNIKPETIFKNESHAKNVKENAKESLVDYIADGQYLVYYVSLAPETGNPLKDCFDQVGFRFGFAFNLKDSPTLGQNNSGRNNCNNDPNFAVKVRPDYETTATYLSYHRKFAQPKLYDIPDVIINKYFVTINEGNNGFTSETFMPLQIPGKLLRAVDKDGAYVKNLNITDCVLLGGEDSPHLAHGLVDSNKARGIFAEVDKIYLKHHNMYKNLTLPLLKPSFSFGANGGQGSEVLTLISKQLAQSECKEKAGEERTENENDIEYQVHLVIQAFDEFQEIALDNDSFFNP